MPISEVSRQNFLNQKSVYDYDREFQKDQANALAMQGERQAQQNALAQQGRLDAQEGRLDAEAGRKQATFDADAYQNKQKGVLSKIPLVRDLGSMRNWIQEAVGVDIVDANEAGQIFQDISSRPEALNEWIQKFDQLGVKAETRYTQGSLDARNQFTQGAQDARSAATSAAAMERTAAQNASRERQAALARENARTIASMPARAAPAGKPLTAQQELKYRGQIAKDHSNANESLQSMADVLESVKAVKDSKGLDAATGYTGTYLPSFTNSDAAKADVRLENLKGKVTQLGKKAAAMAGAIGPMAVQEWKIVRDMIAAIDTVKGKEPLLEQLELVEAHAQGAAERIKAAYYNQYGADLEKYPQFQELNDPGAGPSGATQTPQQGAEVTATNPNTGERVVLRNGQWVPMQ